RVAHASRVSGDCVPQSRTFHRRANRWTVAHAIKDCFGATPKPARETRALPKAFRRVDHVLCVDAAFFHDFGPGGAQTELVQSDDFSVETDIFVPNLRYAGFDRDAFTAFVRQHFFTVFLRLAVESFKTRHGNNADAVAQLFRRGERMLQFASTRKDNQFEFAGFLFRDVTAAQHSFTTQIYIDIVQHRNSLTREREKCRAVRSLHRGDKCSRGFFRISRPNHVDVRHQTNRAYGLHGLMR